MNKQGKEQKNKTHKINKEKQLIIYKSLTIILMLVILFFACKWGYEKYVEIRTEKMYQDMMSQVNTVSESDQTTSGESDEVVDTSDIEDTQTETVEPEEDILPDDVDIPEKNLDWNSLADINSDIYAWIYIPNTKVDYPILQSSDDDSYYLTHNLDGSKGYPGCIYTEKVNYKDFFDFNTIIYGHNMKSGTMFRTLHDFEDKEFFYKNKYIYIYTEEETYVYEIYAAYTTNDAHILNTNDFSTELGRQAYIETSVTHAEATGGNVRNDVDVTTDSKIITLSTCTSKSNQRFLVQAIRLN